MPETTDSASILHTLCTALLDCKLDEARTVLTTQYPFSGAAAQSRSYSEIVKTRLFLRDGFIDRYSGKKLVFIGILRLISFLMPEAFPYHTNWKMDSCHQAYWELAPTLDHIVPVTRGGLDRLDNWVTTSMLRNSIKSNWTLEEIGWPLLPPGNRADWDGLITTFTQLVEADRSVIEQKFIVEYYRIAKSLLVGM